MECSMRAKHTPMTRRVFPSPKDNRVEKVTGDSSSDRFAVPATIRRALVPSLLVQPPLRQSTNSDWLQPRSRHMQPPGQKQGNAFVFALGAFILARRRQRRETVSS